MRSKRLFIALEVPPSCTDLLARLDPGVDGVHWLKPEEMFLALSLQWQLDAPEEERLHEALSRVQIHPFFLPLQSIGAFGRPPAIAISVGIGKGHPHFFALHRRIQDAALHAKLQADLRPFHPHVTVARTNETPRGKFQHFLRDNADAEFCMWKVHGFALHRVEEGSEGPEYSVEKRFQLE